MKKIILSIFILIICCFSYIQIQMNIFKIEKVTNVVYYNEKSVPEKYDLAKYTQYVNLVNERDVSLWGVDFHDIDIPKNVLSIDYKNEQIRLYFYKEHIKICKNTFCMKTITKI